MINLNMSVDFEAEDINKIIDMITGFGNMKNSLINLRHTLDNIEEEQKEKNDPKEYRFIFSKETSKKWSDDEKYCDTLIRQREEHFNNELKMYGFVLLDDVVKGFGIDSDYKFYYYPKTAGWIYRTGDAVKFNVRKFRDKGELKYEITVRCLSNALEDSENE